MSRLSAAILARTARGRLAKPARRRPQSAGEQLALDAGSWERFGRLALVGRQAAQAGLGGEHRSRSRAPSTEFVDYRAYQPGDDFRRVDWNVYGRLGNLQVKITEAPERLDVLLALDCSASMRSGSPDKLAYATQIAAALGFIALERADRLRLALLDQEGRAVGPLQGGASFPQVLQFLAPVVARARQSPADRLRLAERLAGLSVPGRRPLVVLISDLLEVDTAALGAALDRLLFGGADLALIQVLSPQEEEPAAHGAVELVDSETGELLDVTVSVAALTRYQRRLATWLGEIEGLTAARGLRYVRARTDRPTDALVLDDLRRAGLVR